MNIWITIALIAAGIIVFGIIIYAVISLIAIKTVTKAQKNIFEHFDKF